MKHLANMAVIDRFMALVKRLLYTALSGSTQSQAPVKKRLCIYKCDGVGDFVLALSAIRLLVDKFGESQTVIVTFPLGAELALAEFPGVAQVVLPVPGAQTGLSKLGILLQQKRILKTYEFDSLVSLRHSRSDLDDLALSWICAKRTYGIVFAETRDPGPAGFVYRFSDPLDLSLNRMVQVADYCEEFDNHRALLAKILGRDISPSEIIPVMGSLSLRNENFAMVCPLASGATPSLKDIPAGLLEEGIRRIKSLGIDRVYLCGSTFQRLVLERQVQSLADAGLEVGLLTPARLSQFADRLAAARIVYTADSAAAHLATALDKPTVVLIGGAHIGRFGPWSKSSRQVWLTNRIPCFGCNWLCSEPEPYCITRISPSSVTSALEHALEAARADMDQNCAG